MRMRRRAMSVHVGEVSTEVQVTGGEGRSGDGGSQVGPAKVQPGWMDRERHQALERMRCRDAARTAARRFDG
jgi:hypothetical protein